MKTFEKLVKAEIMRKIRQALDPMQFAYKPHKGVEDATATLLNLFFKHLEGNGPHAKLLSLAFNKFQFHILTSSLLDS